MCLKADTVNQSKPTAREPDEADTRRGPHSSINNTIVQLRKASERPEHWVLRPDGMPYLPWQAVANLLDQHSPSWETRTVSITDSETRVAVTIELSLSDPAGGRVARQATAESARWGKRRDGTTFVISAALPTAERRAFCRAATWFGIGANPPDSLVPSTTTAPTVQNANGNQTTAPTRPAPNASTYSNCPCGCAVCGGSRRDPFQLCYNCNGANCTKPTQG